MLSHFLLIERAHNQEVDSEKYAFRDVTPSFNIDSLERNALDLGICNDMSSPLKSSCTVINLKRHHFEGVNICVFLN
jgi:hypothetical protein